MLDPSLGTQRNSKLECFLKRSLPSERYNRLRAYEACIIDKTLKYIIVGDQCIYLTENPPRTVQPVIFYPELRDVELKYDLPNFLQGLEREQTLHIVLTYSKNFHKQTPDSTSPDTHQSQSSLFLNTLSTRTQTSRTPTIHRKRSFDETLLQSSRSIVDHSMDGSNTLLSTSLPSKLWHTLERNFKGNDTNTSEEQSIGKCKMKPSLIHRIRKPFSRVWYNFLNMKRHGMLKNRQSTSKVRLKTDEDSDINNEDENERLPSPRDLSESKTKTSHGSKVTHGPGKSSNALQIYVLDVYLLKNNSPSLDLIRYAWDNYLIRTTEQLSNGRCTDVSTQDIQSLSVQPELLFVRIKQELLNECYYSDVLIFLCSRLHTSALSCFTIKKLFWKDPELFMFFVGILCKYVPGFVLSETVCDSKEKDNKLQSLLCLILEILRVMFRETEVVSSRISTLVAAKEGVYELMKILVSLLSSQPAPIRERDQLQSLKSSIPEELTELGIGVIFELFLCVQQKLDGSKEDVCIGWLVSVMEDIGAEDMINGMVSQVLEMTKPRSNANNCVEVSCLLPLQVLKLYQHYYILAVILENSSELAEYIHSNYLTEFKYLVQVPMLKQRLSTHCPLSSTVLQLIVKVLQKIVY